MAGPVQVRLALISAMVLCLAPVSMLLTTPVELQHEIMSYLTRRDLVSLALTSRQLHTTATPELYAHVELRSFDELEAYFSVGASSPTLSSSAAADSKIAQWKALHTLSLRLRPKDSQRTLGPLPSSLLALAPLPLDRLRVSFHDSAEPILPLLQLLDPRDVGLVRTARPPAGLAASLGAWATATTLLSWTNITHLAFALSRREFDDEVTDDPDDPTAAPEPASDGLFASVKTATFAYGLDQDRDSWDVMDNDYSDFQTSVQQFLRLCPALDWLTVYAAEPTAFDELAEMVLEAADEMGSSARGVKIRDTPTGRTIPEEGAPEKANVLGEFKGPGGWSEGLTMDFAVEREERGE